MLAAMQPLVGKQIALVARREPVDESPIGLDRAERRRIILARRGEQLGAGAVMRRAEDYNQLRRLMRHQLIVGVGIDGRTASRIDMRRDQSGQRLGPGGGWRAART